MITEKRTTTSARNVEIMVRESQAFLILHNSAAGIRVKQTIRAVETVESAGGLLPSLIFHGRRTINFLGRGYLRLVFLDVVFVPCHSVVESVLVGCRSFPGSIRDRSEQPDIRRMSKRQTRKR